VIVTRTPFRVTLGGGGTDLPAFYRKHGAYVLAMGIDKYMYVALNVPYADRLVRLHYTQSETVERVDQLKHELAREALKHHGIKDAIEIASLADLPAGTGLGSSSCYLVGLLNAVRAYLLQPGSFAEMAQDACTIELDVLKKPIGKQDQYLAAFGGLTELTIATDGTVDVHRISLPSHAIAELVSKTHMYYTNTQHVTTDILAEESAALQTGDRRTEDALVQIRDIGREIGKAIKGSDFDQFGRLLHEHWTQKKRLSDRIVPPGIEELYTHAREAFGVLGGKIVGAGGGGFLQLYCPDDGAKLTAFMRERGFPRLAYNADFDGTRVLTNTLASRSMHYHLDKDPT
jgi:D-glycero-alpha-D-manno-heptose-7-phosphate kinase